MNRKRIGWHLNADGVPAFAIGFLSFGTWWNWPGPIAVGCSFGLGMWVASYAICRFVLPRYTNTLWKKFNEVKFPQEQIAASIAELIEQQLRNDGYEVTVNGTKAQSPRSLN